MIISVLQEELVIQKRLILVEEVHVTKRKTQHQVSQVENLRREEISVEQSVNEGANPR